MSATDRHTKVINTKQPGDYGYIAFAGTVRCEVYAPTLWEAKQRVIAALKVTKGRQAGIHIMVAERPDGTEVSHVAVD